MKKARGEELLYWLLWSADMLMRPTFRNLTDSFEEWAYKMGFGRELRWLEQRDLLERKPGIAAPVYRLTEAGRVRALGGRDPQRFWQRRWDGKWRLVAFDLPEVQSSTRKRLRRFLRDHGFGYLQNSVWITPDPLDEVVKAWKGFGEDVESLITLEARPCAGERDSAIVAGAWDFERINHLYAQCLGLLDKLPAEQATPGRTAGALQRWARAEQAAWLEAVTADPLLPSALLPADYLGQKVWQKRISVLGRARKLIE
jgi:phenylacetic acid degradation operon negative regulatory protein